MKDKTTYLYPSNVAWTSDYNNNSKAWITSKRLVDANVNVVNYLEMSNAYNFAVYPSVNIKKGIKLTNGDGTINNPYEFSKTSVGKAGDLINTRNTGEYVSYAGTTYRIIEAKKDSYAKVISTSPIGNLESSLSTGNSTIYNPKSKDNLGYYIENNVSKMIKSDIFVKNKVIVPIYEKNATYSGEKTTKEYSVKFAAPNMYEMFSGASNSNSFSYWLINSSKQELTNYLVSNNDSIYYTNVSALQKVKIRITGYINKDVTILSGKGTIEKPYILQK